LAASRVARRRLCKSRLGHSKVTGIRKFDGLQEQLPPRSEA
jgi:hypothetical protein